LIAGGAAVYAAQSGIFRPVHRVPGLVGDTEARAEAALAALHLHLSVAGEDYSSTAPAGDVLSQTPTEGTLREGGTVRVVLSKGPAPFPVPRVTGKPLDQAITTLRAARLVVPTPGYTFSMTVPKGDVIGQVPASGDVLPGQQVILAVSLGKPMVSVPALNGAQLGSFAAARAALAAAGIGLVATETQTYSDTVPAGQVVATIPPPNVSVPVGSAVTVEVSKGPLLIPVPSLTGYAVTYAAQVLGNYGFQVSSVSGNPLSPVTGTNPPQGTLLRKGSSVAIITS
jgi:serine/threonine-protein kinase